MQTQTHTTRLHSEEHVDRDFRAAVTGAQIVVGACIIWVEIRNKMVPEDSWHLRKWLCCSVQYISMTGGEMLQHLNSGVFVNVHNEFAQPGNIKDTSD